MGNKGGGNNRVSAFFVFISSVLASLLLSFVIHTYINFIYVVQPENHKILLDYIVVAFFVLIFINLFFIGTSISRRLRGKKDSKELSSFKEFSTLVHAANNEEDALEKFFYFIKGVIPVDRVTLFYKDSKNPTNPQWKQFSGKKIPVCRMKSTNCPVICYNKECYVNDIENDITCAYQDTAFTGGGYICLAIEEQGSVKGVIQLYSRDKLFFNQAIVSKVKSYIDFVKPIIHQKKQISTLSKKANTDKLTGVFNRAYFENFLSNQLELAKGTGKFLSIIMLDIDYFKRVNDTYGHKPGDQVLIVFSRVVKSCLRDTDVLSRYGGEEFLVILPDTQTSVAIKIAERMRIAISNQEMPKVNGKRMPNITCSLGVSTFPSHSTDKDTLIKLADDALYKAKQGGRNRVCVYGESSV